MYMYVYTSIRNYNTFISTKNKTKPLSFKQTWIHTCLHLLGK